jgi:hypothetical protein
MRGLSRYDALARLRRSWNKRSFEHVIKAILRTAPLHLEGDSPLFLSLVCHRDLVSYLLAVKSLYLNVGRGQVVIIDDGSLTASDREILHHHIPRLKVLDIASIETSTCPRGGCWERLIKIIELSNEHYVIQFDADTLVCDTIPEVVQCWQDNKSFLLGTGSGQEILPAPHTASMVRDWVKSHGWSDFSVGVAAEGALDELPNATQRSYVHASAGFAGFARGAYQMADLTWFSAHMSDILGERRWREWGSEQIASNYILANAPEGIVLPFPRYACFEPHLKCHDHAFLHFIGTYRYDEGVYLRRAAEFISRYDLGTQGVL